MIYQNIESRYTEGDGYCSKALNKVGIDFYLKTIYSTIDPSLWPYLIFLKITFEMVSSILMKFQIQIVLL
jgi:hypothetical protein